MTFFKKIAILLLLLICANSGFAQTLKAYETAAETAFTQRNYHAAIEYFEILLEIDSKNPNYLYKYAESLRGYDAYEQADTIYRKVRLEADTLYPLATYWEGKMKQRMGQYVPAQMTFEFYLANHENFDPKYTQRAKKAIEEIDWAVEAGSEPNEDIAIDRLSDKINSDYSEFGASMDGSRLYYSSFAYTYEKDDFKPARQFSKVLQSEDDEFGEFVESFNDKARHTAHFVYNTDTTKVYYTLCDYATVTDVRCEIFTRDINPDGSYSAPVKLPANINVPGKTATQPSIGKDSVSGYELLFFASDRDGGRGDLDLWCSIINPNGEISAPVNLPEVNSPDDDITPFFHTPSQTLYYSSNGFLNMGGYDVFKSKKSNDSWSTPENMGAPINSSYDDISYWLNEGEMISLFSSKRLGSNFLDAEKEACCFDIYRSRVTAIDLIAFTFNKKDDAELLGAKVTLYEVMANGELREVDSRVNEYGNDYPWKLETGRKYIITAEKDEFLPISDTIDLKNPALLTSKIIERELYLEPEALEFLARVFDKDTKNPLKGATMQFFIGNDLEDLVINKNNNEFPLTLKRDNKYKIIISKPGYFPDTLVLDMKELGNPLSYQYDFYLKEKSIQDIVPMILYFDNDRPNPKTMRVTSDRSYSETAANYYARKQTFITEYTNVLEGRDRFLAENRMEAFFEREIKDGDENLKVFCYKLIELLDAGQVIKIYIKGYASPRAGAEYNFNLGRRRVDCIRNQFDRYQRGLFQKYLNNNQLNIEEISFGSSKAPKRLTDKLSDDRESVFGILASRERRVEIVGIRLDDGKTVIDTVNPDGK